MLRAVRLPIPVPGRGWVLAVLLCASASVQAQQERRAPPGLSAYRPQNGPGTFPFQRTRVPDTLEEDPLLGPGIRIHGAGETDPAGEDDLIELKVERAFAKGTLVLQRSSPVLSVWGTRNRLAGTKLAFTGNQSAPIVFGGAPERTLWVEWSGASAGLASLALRTLEPGRPVDRVVFHAFEGLVVALGGEDQAPGLPLDANHGTFVVATELYERGWDVLMRDEDEVSNVGSGPVYDEVVNAIQNRSVGQLAIFGYSHGGGSTYHLCERLDMMRGTIGAFSIDFTSYVDGVRNNSNVDTAMELRLPPSSAFHANHYQRGVIVEDFLLDGGPVIPSEPAPTGLDVETVFWGVGATHFVVDDYSEVIDFILMNLEPRVGR